ncbi:MAG: nuclear transport factor 2 family protein [Actinobacteria bacterium]|nr:nuclear transport factor 2 family protein [Actinomycetota bacterium]
MSPDRDVAWTGTADERIALIRRLFDTTVEHELDPSIYAEALVWHMPKGRGRLMGERVGRAAVDEAFAHVLTVAGEFRSRTEPWEIVADDRDTISFNHDSGTRASDGAPFAFDVAMRWEIQDGQITVMHEYIQDEQHKGEFF